MIPASNPQTINIVNVQSIDSTRSKNIKLRLVECLLFVKGSFPLFENVCELRSNIYRWWSVVAGGRW